MFDQIEHDRMKTVIPQYLQLYPHCFQGFSDSNINIANCGLSRKMVSNLHYVNLYINLRRPLGEPAGRCVCGVDSFEVCVKSATRRFIYLFWGIVTLST